MNDLEHGARAAWPAVHGYEPERLWLRSVVLGEGIDGVVLRTAQAQDSRGAILYLGRDGQWRDIPPTVPPWGDD